MLLEVRIEDGDRAVIVRPTLPINLATLGSADVPESEAITVDLKSSYITQYNVSWQQELPGTARSTLPTWVHRCRPNSTKQWFGSTMRRTRWPTRLN
jgi:hypothetical protein